MNSFHIRCLRRILGITWKDHITNKQVLERADITTVHTLLKQRRLRWLGHVSRMEDERIPKDLLYGELATGKRPTGRPQMRYRDVCKQDMKTIGIDPDTWERVATDRCSWRRDVRNGLVLFEHNLIQQTEDRRHRHKMQSLTVKPASSYRCGN